MAGGEGGVIASRYDRARMTDVEDRPVSEQLAELGAQLAWVRDYL